MAADLKKIYESNTIELAEQALDNFEVTWGDKYPIIIKSWRQSW